MQDIPQLPEFIPPPKSYEEMIARPSFQQQLDDTQHKLDRILTPYHFPQQAPCGRRGCRQPHNNGFLVLTVDGFETNVGNKCGVNIFGDEAWSTQVQELTKRQLRRAQLLRAKELKDKRPEVKRLVSDLYNAKYGFKWQKEARANLIRVLGNDLFQILQTTEKRKAYEVVTAVERSHDEIERLHKETGESKAKLRFVKTREVPLQPMPWITYDPNAELYLGLLDPLSNFAELDHERLNPLKLKKALKKFDNWEHRVKAAKDVCDSAPNFFDPVNLASIAKWMPEYKKEKRKRFEDWCRSVEYHELAAGLDDESDDRVAAQP